ncbi:diguanylate cyclase domain-containing protein [Photobacterium alginatilyticum]|uniref:diguanylate cyclase domain-containing protein n=1 Tax=Photobacterium alginatilyticum TaxID=1775171 RepID=UPI004068E501
MKIIKIILWGSGNDELFYENKAKHCVAYKLPVDIIRIIFAVAVYVNFLFARNVSSNHGSVKFGVNQHVKRITKKLASAFLSVFKNDETTFQSLLFNTDDAIYIINPISMKIIGCNRNAFGRLQYSYNEMLRMRFSQIDSTNGAIGRWNEIIDLVERKKSITIESTHLRKDNSPIPVEVNISVGRYNGSECFVAIVRDLRLQELDKEKLWIEANIDPLTRLPNRRIFKDKLIKILDDNMGVDGFVVMFYIDIDHFKKLNDTLGHSVGDEVLVTVAHRLKHCIRGDDCIARFGGDEFVMVFTGLKSSAISPITNKIKSVFSEKVKTREYLLNVNASIGVGVFDTNNLDLDMGIDLVDKAMYQAKKSNGTSIYFHLEEM